MAVGCTVHNEAAFDMRESNPAATLCRLKGTRMQISKENKRDAAFWFSVRAKAAALESEAVLEVGSGTYATEVCHLRGISTGLDHLELDPFLKKILSNLFLHFLKQKLSF